MSTEAVWDTRRVRLVDLATGEWAPQPHLLNDRSFSVAGRLSDGRIVCAGGMWASNSSVEVWGPPQQGPPDAAWSWRELPQAMHVVRNPCRACVMSDGRFAVLNTSSCGALVLENGGDAHWEPLPPMHQDRNGFACGSVAGCIIVAGGSCLLSKFDDVTYLTSAEVYDEERNRWFRLPCNLPYEHGICNMGSAVM